MGAAAESFRNKFRLTKERLCMYLAVDRKHNGLDLTSLSSLTPDVDHSDSGAQAAEALVIQGARLAG